MNNNNELMIPEEVIMSKIFMIRDRKVMLDKDLAELYEVKAIRLREQVKRNLQRFPESFMFRLTEEETNFMVSQNAIPSLSGHDDKIQLIFEYLNQLEQERHQQLEQKERKRIGFKRDGEAQGS